MSETDQAVAKLKDACDRAYANNLSSCSNAVWDLIKALVNSGEQYKQANDFIDYWDENWKSVDLEEGFKLANQGVVVVGGLQVQGRPWPRHCHLSGDQDTEWRLPVFLQESRKVS
jgi:hypothetical protein